MSRNESRKYQRKIELIKQIVGGDMDRDVIQTSISDVDIDAIPVESLPTQLVYTSMDEVGGQELSGVDIAARIEALSQALKTNGEDELVSRVVDSSGSEIDPATVALEDALKSNDDDELVSRIVDTSGDEVDPATISLEDALKSNGDDEFVTRLTGEDGVEISEEEIGTGISDTDVALITYLARALESVGEDEIVSRLTDSSGTQVDPATDAIEDALSSNGDDDIRVDIQAGEISRLGDKIQYTFSDRYEDVADDDTVFDILVSNPSDSDVDIVFSPSFLPGGLAHLDVSEDITVDTSGDSMNYLTADVMSGESPELDVEEGGSYTVEGDTIRTVLQGTDRVGGPSSTSGAQSPIITAKLISPGESVLYSATNRSGGEATYAAEIGAIEL